jgi:hypothetical protein
MKTYKSFFIAFTVLFLTIISNQKSIAQDSTGSIDSKLTGTWQTDEQNAVFQKIQFGDDGSFTGYSLSADSKPFATGTYGVKDKGIFISASISISTMNKGEPMAVSYNFTNYTITKDNKLQFTPSDRKGMLTYTNIKTK